MTPEYLRDLANALATEKQPVGKGLGINMLKELEQAYLETNIPMTIDFALAVIAEIERLRKIGESK